MCYHVSFEINLESITAYFPDLVIDPQLEINFPKAAYANGFDHGMQPVMLLGRKDGKKHLAAMMWGFVPNGIKNYEAAERFWNGYKDDNGKWNTGFITLNAMGEELLEKKLYREAALSRRCIVFVDGFYEWHHYYPMGKKGQRLKTAIKYPHHIFLKDNPLPFVMMAGIWNAWKHEEVDKETGELETIITPTFAIITTKANELMSKVHNSKMRMPTILTKELAEEWLKEDLPEDRIIQIATHQYPADQMTAFTVPKDFQEMDSPKTKHNYPEFESEFC